MSVLSRRLWHVEDRTPDVVFLYFDVLRQYKHVMAGDLPSRCVFPSFFVPDQFVSSFELILLYVIEKLSKIVDTDVCRFRHVLYFIHVLNFQI